jgi:hypothetical protein
VIYFIKMFSIKTKICIITIQSIKIIKLIPRFTPYCELVIIETDRILKFIYPHIWYNSCWIWANITICINMCDIYWSNSAFIYSMFICI